MKRILVLRLSALGDVIHTIPAVTALRDADVSWVVEAPYAELVEIVAGVEAIPVRMKKWGRSLISSRGEIHEALAKMRRADVSIDFQGLMKSAMLGKLSGAETRVGFEKPRERASRLFTNQKVAVDTTKHVVEQNLELATAAIGRSSPGKPPHPPSAPSPPQTGEKDLDGGGARSDDPRSRAEGDYLDADHSSALLPRAAGEKDLDGGGARSDDPRSRAEGDDLDADHSSAVLARAAGEKDLDGGGARSDDPRSRAEGDDLDARHSSALLPRAAGEKVPKADEGVHAVANWSAFPQPMDVRPGKIVILPGAGKPSKLWPIERFRELAAKLDNPLVVWGPGEAERAQAIGVRVAPPTNLRELAWLLQSAELVIGGDTGPLHLAAALGTKVVGLYGPTNPRRNGPYGQLDHVVDESVTTKLMKSITVEAVMKAVERVSAE